MSLQVHDFNVQVKIGKWKMYVIFKQLHIRVLSIYGTLTFFLKVVEIFFKIGKKRERSVFKIANTYYDKIWSLWNLFLTFKKVSTGFTNDSRIL